MDAPGEAMAVARAELLLVLGDADGARAVLEPVAASPASALPMVRMAIACWNAGQEPEAERWAREATERFPEDGEAWWTRAWVLLQQREAERAVPAAQRAATLTPSAGPGAMRVVAELASGDLTAAERSLIGFEASLPQDVVDRLRGLLHAKAGRWQDASAHLEAAMARSQGDRRLETIATAVQQHAGSRSASVREAADTLERRAPGAAARAEAFDIVGRFMRSSRSAFGVPIGFAIPTSVYPEPAGMIVVGFACLLAAVAALVNHVRWSSLPGSLRSFVREVDPRGRRAVRQVLLGVWFGYLGGMLVRAVVGTGDAGDPENRAFAAAGFVIGSLVTAYRLRGRIGRRRSRKAQLDVTDALLDV